MTRAACLAALCLLAAACNNEAAAPAEEGGAASGEVLEGTISDAMIPLDQLASEAPLAPRQVQAVSGDIDAEQPEVTPVPGIEDAPAPAPAPAPAVPAPVPPQP